MGRELAVALQEASRPEYTEYAVQVVKNAKVLAEGLLERGFHLVTGGTDNHLILIDMLKGHGIPVAFTFTITDVTKNTVLDSESSAVGHGHAHRHQPTTHCSGVLFSGLASDFFGGGQLPPGVDPGDTIAVSISGQVIVKL